MKTAALHIKTPEGIVFSQTLAGPVMRFLAWSIDFLSIGLLVFTLVRIMGMLELFDANFAATVFTLGYFLINFGYGIFFEWWWRGQTVGKRVFGLRVVDAEGMRLKFDQIVTRNLLRFVDLLPGLYFVGGVACCCSTKCQRLGDLAANTIVIRSPAVSGPDVNPLVSGKFNSLRQYPHLVARLRQHVTPGEATTALQALVRRDGFDPGARVVLFEELAAHFRSKVEFPAEATDGIADEQYIRNVVDVIYRTRGDESR